MKTIVLYQAVDGSNWQTEAEALTRDALCLHVDTAMGLLKPRPTDAGFDNGKSFVQQEAGACLAAKRHVVDLARAATRHSVFTNDAEKIHPMSIAGRILSDMGGPLNVAWWRFACIDGRLREWGQPYFVTHPNEKAMAV